MAKGKSDKLPKASKAAKQGAIRTPAIGLVGLLLLGVIAVMLLRHQLDLQQAAVRAAVVMAALVVTERLLLPLARTLIGPSNKP